MEVNDNGTGIPLEFQPRVFEMFYRAIIASQGTGLGLYIVKKAVEKSGGSVQLHSEIRKGTRVKVVLPK